MLRRSRAYTPVAALYTGAAAPAWTPADLGAGTLSIWYDASVLTSTWQDTAGTVAATAAADPVARWNDLTANAYHVTQSTAGSRLTRRVDAGGLPYLEMDATDDFLAFPAGALSLFQNQGQGWAAWAGFASSIAAGTPAIVGFPVNTSATNNRFNFGRSGSRLRLAVRRLDADTQAELLSTTGDVVVNTNYVGMALMDWSTGNGKLRKNGVQVAVNAAFTTTGSTSNTVSTASSIGRAGASGTPLWGGGIHALLGGRTLPTAGEIASIETWLGGKCGLTI